MSPADPLNPDELMAPMTEPSAKYPLSPNPEDENVKIPKEEVAYGHPPQGKPNSTCSRCSNYEGSYRCTLVQGDIMPDGWCTEWTDGFREPGSRRRGTPAVKAETTTAASVGVGPILPLGSSIRSRKPEDEEDEEEDDEE